MKNRYEKLQKEMDRQVAAGEINPLGAYEKKNKILEMTIYSLFILTVFVFSFFLSPIKVGKGDSMSPTIKSNSLALTNHFAKPDYGKIVLLKLNEMLMYKRVIAMGGDELRFEDGDIYLNGCLLDESEYLQDSKTYYYISIKTLDYENATITVPKDCVFVMGDNRMVSGDSRDFGFVPKKDVYGCVIGVIPLKDKEGSKIAAIDAYNPNLFPLYIGIITLIFVVTELIAMIISISKRQRLDRIARMIEKRRNGIIFDSELCHRYGNKIPLKNKLSYNISQEQDPYWEAVLPEINAEINALPWDFFVKGIGLVLGVVILIIFLNW